MVWWRRKKKGGGACGSEGMGEWGGGWGARKTGEKRDASNAWFEIWIAQTNLCADNKHFHSSSSVNAFWDTRPLSISEWFLHSADCNMGAYRTIHGALKELTLSKPHLSFSPSGNRGQNKHLKSRILLYNAPVICIVNLLMLLWMCVWLWMLSTLGLIPGACTFYLTGSNKDILIDWLIEFVFNWVPSSEFSSAEYPTCGKKNILTDWLTLFSV